MGGDGVAEELEDRLALQLEGLCHGQDPLDETEAFFAVAAKGDFPPQDQASQDPLGQVVGWFHPLPADKSPLRLLEPWTSPRMIHTQIKAVESAMEVQDVEAKTNLHPGIQSRGCQAIVPARYFSW